MEISKCSSELQLIDGQKSNGIWDITSSIIEEMVSINAHEFGNENDLESNTDFDFHTQLSQNDEYNNDLITKHIGNHHACLESDNPCSNVNRRKTCSTNAHQYDSEISASTVVNNIPLLEKADATSFISPESYSSTSKEGEKDVNNEKLVGNFNKENYPSRNIFGDDESEVSTPDRLPHIPSIHKDNQEQILDGSEESGLDLILEVDKKNDDLDVIEAFFSSPQNAIFDSHIQNALVAVALPGKLRTLLPHSSSIFF
jgi:hypothetical protein